MSGTTSFPAPYFPDAPSITQPEAVFDAQFQNLGLNLGWMRSHTCPCAAASGNPDPECQSCYGRGIYWEDPKAFLGYYVYMHTGAAPEEPGASVNARTGLTQAAEPVLSIPKNGSLSENEVWTYAALFDAYVELDATTRYSDLFSTSDSRPMALTNPVGATILGVTRYDLDSKKVATVPLDEVTVANGVISLDSSLEGMGVSVDYTALPTHIAYNKTGGLIHNRPFAQGRDGLPKRFHIQALDVFLRSSTGSGGMNAITLPSGY